MPRNESVVKKDINEELPTASVGAGDIAGVSDDIPIVRKKSIKKLRQFLNDKLKEPK